MKNSWKFAKSLPLSVVFPPPLRNKEFLEICEVAPTLPGVPPTPEKWRIPGNLRSRSHSTVSPQPLRNEEFLEICEVAPTQKRSKPGNFGNRSLRCTPPTPRKWRIRGNIGNRSLSCSPCWPVRKKEFLVIPPLSTCSGIIANFEEVEKRLTYSKSPIFAQQAPPRPPR